MYLALPIIQGSTLTATPAVYYTSPTGTYTRVTQFSLTNTDTSPRIVQVYLCTSSAAPTTADFIVKNKTLAVAETWVPYQALGAVLSPGYTIQLSADSAGVVVAKASGIQLS